VWRPTPAQVAAAHGKTIRDVIGPGLTVLFCGINPSLYSAAVGHHFARPGNRFWPALHAAGITARHLSAFEDRDLLALGCGITNLVARATAAAAELTDDELRRGARALERKVRRHRPRLVAFLGVGSYRTAFDRRHAALGLQPERLGATPLWVLPNPSGLNAHYQLADLARLFAALRRRAFDNGPP
jgi:TDG/mug DNA glycosylase family protein